MLYGVRIERTNYPLCLIDVDSAGLRPHCISRTLQCSTDGMLCSQGQPGQVAKVTVGLVDRMLIVFV